MASKAMLTLLTQEEETGKRELRFRVLFSASLITTTDEYAVTVRDISITGFGIEGPRVPPVGADVLLRRRASEFFARVVWSEGGRAGLEFDEPISAAEVLAQLNGRSAGNSAGMVPAERHTPLGADDLAIARAWLGGAAAQRPSAS